MKEDPSSSSDMEQRARDQFARTAAHYVTSAIHARGEDLDWLLEMAGDVRGLAVLDVATGAGHTALRFARAGARVTATDLTEAMLETAREFTRSQGADITFCVAPARAQPFADASFDIVTCRIAAHHFDDIDAFLVEARRLLRPGGRFFLVDNIAPEDEDLDRAMNHIERLRDPSHVRAYRVSQWIVAMARAGLEPVHLRRWWREKDFAEWVRRSDTPPAVVAEMESTIRQLPERIRWYLGVAVDGERVVRMRHEVALFACVRL